ncbi:M1 family metallopeptidase [Vulgatibacter incomptus]|uniref:Aminopeptidase n=1 Tax=Vulgatibacter incomptus TaxID=1391653 RepID=A0A0K1PA90_9BACT|nr:M1 family metallopeptidase [Vulgatibacter incomptus]AKU90034.1 Membrane alanine aminopeptidase N [Vulgatibacter incomptus]
MSETAYRLPRDVVPSAYEIDLDVSLRRRGFSGTVIVTARVAKATDQVVLHGRGLRVIEAFAKVGRRRLAAKVKADAAAQTLTLRFDQELPKGELTLTLSYTGKLDPGMNGLYLAKNGPERAIASQCEAAEARAIFPCWDEPDRKATLQWTVRTDPGLTVVTNGAPVSVRRDPKTGTEVHRFEPTKVLPTYLAAVTVGRYEATAVRKVAGTPCRVLALPGKLDQARFAEEVTDQVLPWFTQYFGQRYRYGKLDQVALPAFDAGAMENAGAIFYRQQLLLMDEATTSWHGKKQIAETIAHEIAHQWFGNRVTMRWWDDLWLNEAFATWVSHKAVDEWQPGWRIWDDFQAMRRNAMGLDALETTHPIYSEVESPGQVTELFDAITYYKGCCVLRQIEAWLGAEAFRDGLRVYIDRYKDKNAAGADLWRALGEASGSDVGALAESWILQSGLPLVRIEAKESGGRTVLRLSQRRFFARPEAAEKPNDQRWKIPVQIRWSDGKKISTSRILLEENEIEHELPGKAAWLHGNADGVGFYRVALSQDLLARLTGAGLEGLTAVERQTLLDDAWALVLCGQAPIDRFLDLLAAYRNERDYVVLEAVAGRLDVLVHRLADEASLPALRAFVGELLRPALADLGWEPEPGGDPARASARAAVIAALGDLARDEDVLREATLRADQERAAPASVDANLASVVVRLAALTGDKRRLDTYVAEYERRRQRRAPPEEQLRYLGALSAFERPALVKAVLELSLSDVVPQESMVGVLRPLLSRPASTLATWRFLSSRWSEVVERAGLMQISRLVEGLGALPLAKRGEMKRFFEAHPVEEARRAIAIALQEMELRDELRKREAPRLAAWIAGR